MFRATARSEIERPQEIRGCIGGRQQPAGAWASEWWQQARFWRALSSCGLAGSLLSRSPSARASLGVCVSLRETHLSCVGRARVRGVANGCRMSWMPKADRIAAVGDGTRLNKTVAKIDLTKLRTSCQINYPESPSKYHVAPTVGGPPKPAPPRTSIDHMNPPKANQVRSSSSPGGARPPRCRCWGLSSELLTFFLPRVAEAWGHQERDRGELRRQSLWPLQRLDRHLGNCWQVSAAQTSIADEAPPQEAPSG